MKFPIGSLLTFATRALTAIATGVPAMQAAADKFKGGSGPEKKAAVLDLVRAELGAAEMATGKNLANDDDVLAAAGTVIDAAAAFHKIVAHKAIGTSA